ncbi:YczE/YyaS/YitT family protein [Bacillus alkalicellulosilyticus]|uniref:YczE/YyaS/YitT family protein n=1 Tax=Alkalihalobacterium alkalicellulosilyticum TaxID=1912214 RepID=UPI001482497A|nr:YitT family protein [Bacillus alkalicellulosilyticus]
MNTNVRRGISFVLGLFIIASGVSLTIKANIGVGGWDAFNVGLANKFGLTVGTWVIIVSISLIIINALLLRKRPEFESLVTSFLIGYFIDFWLLLVLRHLEIGYLPMQIVAFLIGLVLISIGAASYLQARFAPIPVDGLMLAFRSLFGLSIMMAKMVTEIIAVILALIVAGPIGLGTILVAFLIGPLIQFWYTKIEKIVYHQVENNPA